MHLPSVLQVPWKRAVAVSPLLHPRFHLLERITGIRKLGRALVAAVSGVDPKARVHALRRAPRGKLPVGGTILIHRWCALYVRGDIVQSAQRARSNTHLHNRPAVLESAVENLRVALEKAQGSAIAGRQ